SNEADHDFDGRPVGGRPLLLQLAFSASASLWSRPPMAPPTSGAAQNSQSCCSAHPPSNRAGPVERAGLTEVLVTGMEIRWIRVRASPMAIGAKPAGTRVSVEPRIISRKKP